MATTLQAKPTVFKHVLFRSKSEAVFAVSIEKVPNGMWLYEPDLPGFEFLVDFVLVSADPDANRSEAFATILEYKPGKPSKSFVEKCERSLKAFLESESWVRKICGAFNVVYGSPFGSDTTLHSIEINPSGNSKANDKFAKYIQPMFSDSVGHRFDLE